MQWTDHATDYGGFVGTTTPRMIRVDVEEEREWPVAYLGFQ